MRRTATLPVTPSCVRRLPVRGALMLSLALLAALTAGGSAVAASATAAPAAGARGVAPASVLVNQPAATVCVGQTFRVGVWYQPSGGSRAYRLAVYNPRGTRVFYRHGQAPAKNWVFWRIRARRAGRFRTVYSGHWKSRSAWSTYTAVTRARRC
jgi:hypothetical protein